MIIPAVQVFESLQENCFIFEKISTRENLTCLYYHELKFSQNKAVLLKWFENLNCPYYHELIFSQKQSNFVEVIRKLELPALSRVKFLSKIKQFSCSDSKTWRAPIITSWNFVKKKAVLLKWFENLNCPYYHELKFCQKESSFVEVIRKLELALLSPVEIFWKINQFCWSDSKTWTAPTITSWNFLKYKAVLLKWFENLNWPHYHELKFSKKCGRF